MNYGIHTAKYQSLKAQAETGDSQAMYDLSTLFKFFINDKENYRLWLEKAANAGHVKAMVNMGEGYSKSNNEEGLDSYLMFGYSKEKYYDWVKKAAETGHSRGICGLADYYFENGEYKTAYQYYEEAVEKSEKDNDENVMFHASSVLADQYDMLWNLENKDEYFLKAEKYYSITLLYKGDIKDPDSTYPQKYLMAVVKLGLLYYQKNLREESTNYDRLAAYCLYMALISDLDHIYKLQIEKPLSQLSNLISVDDMIKWEIHAKYCAYLPQTLN